MQARSRPGTDAPAADASPRPHTAQRSVGPTADRAFLVSRGSPGRPTTTIMPSLPTPPADPSGRCCAPIERTTASMRNPRPARPGRPRPESPQIEVLRGGGCLPRQLQRVSGDPQQGAEIRFHGPRGVQVPMVRVLGELSLLLGAVARRRLGGYILASEICTLSGCLVGRVRWRAYNRGTSPCAMGRVDENSLFVLKGQMTCSRRLSLGSVLLR